MSGDCDSLLPDALVRFVQVLVEDEDLRAWFESFEGLTEADRSRQFSTLVARMQAAGEHPDLIHATALLSRTEIYRATRAALADLLGS